MANFKKIPMNEVYHFLHAHVTKPNDCILYEKEDDENNIYFTYFKALARSGYDGLRPTEESEQLVTLKVRKSDLTEKQMSIEALVQYISRGLKVAIGWDCDKTVTALHTGKGEEVQEIEFRRGVVTKGKIEISRNIRFPKQTAATLRKIAQQEKYIQFMTSSSLADSVEDYISQMFPGETLFCDIHGSKKRGVSRGLDNEQAINQHVTNTKVRHFDKTWNKLAEDGAIDDEGYLILDKTDPFIDVVNGYIIEDDVEKKELFEKTGLQFISVTPNDNQHLIDINRRLQLGLDIKPQLYQKPAPADQDHEPEQVILADDGGTPANTPANSPPNSDDESEKSEEENNVSDEDKNKKLLLLTLDNIPSIKKKLKDIPNDINEKIRQLETELVAEITQLDEQEKQSLSLKARDEIKTKRLKIENLIKDTNLLTQQLLDYYLGDTKLDSQSSSTQYPSIAIEPFLSSLQFKRLNVIQADANVYQSKLIPFTGKQRIAILASAIAGAVLGLVAGAIAGFILGSVPGAIIGGAIGVVAGVTLFAPVASLTTYAGFFSANKKEFLKSDDSLKLNAYKYGESVREFVQDEKETNTLRVRNNR